MLGHATQVDHTAVLNVFQHPLLAPQFSHDELWVLDTEGDEELDADLEGVLGGEDLIVELVVGQVGILFPSLGFGAIRGEHHGADPDVEEPGDIRRLVVDDRRLLTGPRLEDHEFPVLIRDGDLASPGNHPFKRPVGNQLVRGVEENVRGSVELALEEGISRKYRSLKIMADFQNPHKNPGA